MTENENDAIIPEEHNPEEYVKVGDINALSKMNLNSSQTTETEEPEDIRTNEQYNLRPKPAHRPTINL